MDKINLKTDAIFSKDGKHRLQLSRFWDESLPSVLFIGLNPSIANEEKNDPTITRTTGFAEKWGYGGFYMANLFSLIETSPKRLVKRRKLIHPDNDKTIQRLIREVDLVILAYGNLGLHRNRHQQILKLVDKPYCISITRLGLPTHPLYQKYTNKPIKYTFISSH